MLSFVHVLVVGGDFCVDIYTANGKESETGQKARRKSATGTPSHWSCALFIQLIFIKKDSRRENEKSGLINNQSNRSLTSGLCPFDTHSTFGKCLRYLLCSYSTISIYYIYYVLRILQRFTCIYVVGRLRCFFLVENLLRAVFEILGKR